MSKRVGFFQKVFVSVVNWLHCPSIMPFYAVAKGRTSGIFMSWPDCEAQVKGFPGARYKKFDSVVSAQEFINTEGGNKSNVSKAKNNIPTKSKPDNNLKRTYNSFSNNQTVSQQNVKPKQTTKAKQQSPQDSDESDSDNSDVSDDLNTMICKQMDDIEKRLKDFEKGVDKIIKKSSGKIRKSILIEPPVPKKKKKSDAKAFDQDNDGFIQVWTDGACSSNGKLGARAGIGVYWGDDHPLNVSEPVSGRATNNCGEIQAATKAIKIALQNGIQQLTINTDSQFLINSVTKWMPGWKRKGWKLKSGEPVKNEIDFKDLDSVQNQLTIRWKYVEAHRGIHGNEMADQLAREGASLYKRAH